MLYNNKIENDFLAGFIHKNTPILQNNLPVILMMTYLTYPI